jgi:hypothetical protein
MQAGHSKANKYPACFSGHLISGWFSDGLGRYGIIMLCMSNVAMTRYDSALVRAGATRYRAALVRERTHRASATNDVTDMKHDMERRNEYQEII